MEIDAETLQIRAIEVATNAIGDAATLPDLLAQIPTNERITIVGGDSAYDTRKCRAAIAARGADAVIPVRRNGQPWQSDAPRVDARNETLRAIKRLGRTIWKRWSGYHRRSLIETKMHCFKLLGERVASRTFDRQITELKLSAAVLNRFSKIGAPNTVRVAWQQAEEAASYSADVIQQSRSRVIAPPASNGFRRNAICSGLDITLIDTDEQSTGVGPQAW